MQKVQNIPTTGCWGEPLNIEQLPVGTLVVFTNEFNVSFPGKRIERVEKDEHGDAYYLTPTDTPWFPARRTNLSIQYEYRDPSIAQPAAS